MIDGFLGRILLFRNEFADGDGYYELRTDVLGWSKMITGSSV